MGAQFVSSFQASFQALSIRVSSVQLAPPHLGDVRLNVKGEWRLAEVGGDSLIFRVKAYV
jgi:hypothetical protein